MTYKSGVPSTPLPRSTRRGHIPRPAWSARVSTRRSRSHENRGGRGETIGQGGQAANGIGTAGRDHVCGRDCRRSRRAVQMFAWTGLPVAEENGKPMRPRRGGRRTNSLAGIRPAMPSCSVMPRRRDEMAVARVGWHAQCLDWAWCQRLAGTTRVIESPSAKQAITTTRVPSIRFSSQPFAGSPSENEKPPNDRGNANQREAVRV